jgi:hypothetical protein
MATAVDYIFDEFQITNEEYAELKKEFENLCYKAAWELKRKNFKNNHTDEIEDTVQDLRWSMSRACVYTKRQRYIESCMDAVESHCDDPFAKITMKELRNLWDDRTRHGANKQKFGAFQEKILESFVNEYVDENVRPSKKTKLEIDKSFSVYCKAIIWNCSKNLGKKITRERSIRSGLVSLSENGFLAEEK